MRCAIWMTASIVGVLLMAGGVLAGEPAGSSSNIAAGGDDQPMKQRLQRKWIVRQVQHGEKPTGAQIGQQPGDIIEVVLTETGLFLSLIHIAPTTPRSKARCESVTEAGT